MKESKTSDIIGPKIVEGALDLMRLMLKQNEDQITKLIRRKGLIGELQPIMMQSASMKGPNNDGVIRAAC